MILDNTESSRDAPTTLDDLFRRAGVRRPQAPALIDPPNREHFTDGAPRRLTYAQADRAISAIASRLRALGLPTDAVVALQFPNTVESVLALLGVLRAGMIAAPLPLLWHRQDAAAALRGIGAKAIVTCARIGATAQAELAMQTAADVFSIRQVCAFGAALPDGVTSFDDVFNADADGTSAVARLADPAAHIAAVSFDVTTAGLVPMARNHRQLIAGGLLPFIESGLREDANILSTIPASSFAGMALTMLPWLLSGGTLTLHHSFDAVSFATQLQGQAFDAVIVPAATLPLLGETGFLGAAKTLIALWRAPERMQRAETCEMHNPVIDVASFGEIGIAAARRIAGTPSPLPCAAIAAPGEAADAPPLVELARGDAGTLTLRGAMVPANGFPFGAKPHPATAKTGFVDSGQLCRFAAGRDALIVTGPPPGIVGVGAYRFVARELDELAEGLGIEATLAVLPQELIGERLAGHAVDRGAVLQELQRRGVNPLIAGAFRRQKAA